MNEIYTVRVERLVYGGDAMGRLGDGRAVFIPFAIPGEVIRIHLVEEKPRFARGEIVEVVEASPQRVTARCAHFTYCGGCHYQHMAYPAQLEGKSAILGEQLQRIGGLRDIPAIEIVTTPEPWNYRNHIQFHLTHNGKLGYQKAHSNQTFAISECHLPEPAINQACPNLDIEPVRSLERVNLRSGAGGDLMLVLESTEPVPLEFDIEDLSISVIQASQAGKVVLAGSDHLAMEVLGRPFRVSSTSFFQVNTALAERMVTYLMENLVLSDTSAVMDVYCGVGLFSAFIAPKVKQLIGIELSPGAGEDFTENLDEFDNVSLYEAAADQVLNSIQFNPQVIIMDPPREGLEKETTQGILAQGARTLAYVSCDPSTLARDAKWLIPGGYKLLKIALFDMFPQTYHLESISFWGLAT